MIIRDLFPVLLTNSPSFLVDLAHHWALVKHAQ
jgi:hypothetical protein